MKTPPQPIETLSRAAAVAAARLEGAQQLVQQLSTDGQLSRLQLDAATALYAPLREAAGHAWEAYMAAITTRYSVPAASDTVTEDEAARYTVLASAELLPRTLAYSDAANALLA